MDNVLKGCYLDDILVTGRTEEEHLRNLEDVIKRLFEPGIRIKRNNCDCFKEGLHYLGHATNAAGIFPVSDKLEAILNAPQQMSNSCEHC